MKLLTTIFLLGFLTHQPHAQAASLSQRNWQDIEADRFVKIEWPMIDIQGAIVPLNQICSTGHTFRTIKTYMLCTNSYTRTRACKILDGERYPELDCSKLVMPNYSLQASEYLKTERVCLNQVNRYLSAPVGHQVTACVDSHGNDASYFLAGELYDGEFHCGGDLRTVTEFAPLTYMVPLVHVGNLGDSGAPMSLGSKSYTIQNCPR